MSLSSSCSSFSLLSFFLFFPLIGGCSPQIPSPEKKTDTQVHSTPAKSTPAKSTPAKSIQVSSTKANTTQPTVKTPTTLVDGETYQIYYPTTPLTTNQGQQTIKIIPKPGYKVNQEFPHRIQVSPSKTLKVKTESIQGKITQKQLHYQISVEGKGGKHSLKAKADFSICNEEMCKLYRAEPVEWTAHIKTP
jgi:multidrug efflux pump subunit AcrB